MGGGSENPEAPTPSPPDAKRTRRCVQSKLSWALPKAGSGGGTMATEEVVVERVEAVAAAAVAEEEKKGKRTGRGRPRSAVSKQSPTANKGTAGLASRTNDEVILIDESPVKKQRKGRCQAVALKVPNRKRCKALESIIGHGSCQQLNNNEAIAPEDPSISPDTDFMSLNSGMLPVDSKIGAVNDLDKPQLTIDLRSEAKIAAMENLKLFSGKQLHPFFASRMVNRSAGQDIFKEEDREPLWAYEKGLVSCPPIHVFDQLEGDVSINWSKWVIKEGSFLDMDVSHPLESAVPVFQCLVGPLTIETCCKGKHVDLALDLRVAEPTTAVTILPKLFNEPNENENPSRLEVMWIDGGYSCASSSDNHVSVFQNKHQDRILNKSCWHEYCLWTDKYQPENASQVCGNNESVKFLSEWLNGWDERGRRSNKNCKSDAELANGDKDNSLYEDESDTGDSDDATDYTNVLLITGPVGSGKSAAVYACAKEQGFNVVEVNSSDMRNGACVKQKFEEATKSHGLEKWSHEEVVSSRREDFLNSISGMPDGAENGYSGSVKLSSNCDQDKTPTKCYWSVKGNYQAPKQVMNKTLILFEDVDTVFDEDRGFISTILHLAETTKWPIILTSNNKNPILPRLLERLVLEFKYPSSEELLSHVDMMCTSEKADISIPLMKHVINTCLGDIRRTTLLLQFWCQGKRVFVDRKDKCVCGPLLLDLDAVHSAMPKLLPWEFPCKLSEKICEEINQTIRLVEENEQVGAPNCEGMNAQDKIGSLTEGKSAVKTRKARKNSKLKKQDQSVVDCTEISACRNDLDDFNNAPDTPLPSDQRRVRNRHGIVLSSESDDSLDDNCTAKDAILTGPKDWFSSDLSAIPSVHKQETSVHFHLPIACRDNIGIVDYAQNLFESNMDVSTSRICDTFMLQDVSYVPESSFISENAPVRNDLLSMVVSSDDLSIFRADGVQTIYSTALEDTINVNSVMAESHKYTEAIVGDTCEGCVESVQRNEQGSCSTSGYQLMDECSRAESMWLLSGKRNKSSCKVGCVQDTWNKLRSSCHELKSCLTNHQRTASEVLELASGIADLISESDLMFTSCRPLLSDMLDASLTPYVEPDDFSWYDKQLEMGSVYAQHGLCFYTKKCEGKCSYLVGSSMDLAQEMLSASTTATSLGKLFSLGMDRSYASENSLHLKNPTSCTSKRREQKFDLCDAILPIIPAKLSVSFKGTAFNEYLSSLSQISRLECSRLSESRAANRPRRYCESRHYLSSGALSFSPEVVELLAQSCSFNDGVRQG